MHIIFKFIYISHVWGKVKVENNQSTELRTQRADGWGSYISPSWAADPEKQV